MSSISINDDYFRKMKLIVKYLEKDGLDVKAVNINNNAVVIKMIRIKDDFISSDILNEFDTLVKLRHIPNIVHLKHICLTDVITLVTEKLTGDLKHLIKQIGEDDRVDNVDNLMFSMLYILSLFEKHNYYYTDMKPNNILWNSRILDKSKSITLEKTSRYVFKLCDFGGVRNKINLDNLYGATLTMQYIPPEILSKRRKSTFDHSKCALWSLGITVLEFLIGHHVFFSSNKDGKSTNSADKQLSLYDPLLREMWKYAVCGSDISTFSKRNKENKLDNERLNVEEIIDRNTYLGRKYGLHLQYTLTKNNKFRSPIVNVLKELLVFNPDKRTSATELLKKYYDRELDEEVNKLFILPEYCRVVYEDGIKVILQLMNNVAKYDNQNNMLTIMAIELYTRYCGTFKKEYDDNIKDDEGDEEGNGEGDGEENKFNIEKYSSKDQLKYAAVSCLNILTVYIRESYDHDYDELKFDCKDYRFNYQQINAYDNHVLKRVDFLIYNSSLDQYYKKIERIDLNTISFSIYSQPINSWFPNLDEIKEEDSDEDDSDDDSYPVSDDSDEDEDEKEE